ncbi:hypothetical protein J6590_013348 [Homalodisca vitripennis]|nr:hypothetical protein J6590_013348 [Homalodisca vitripennis]
MALEGLLLPEWSLERGLEQITQDAVVCFMLLPEWTLERGLEQITQDAGVADVPSLILRVLG